MNIRLSTSSNCFSKPRSTLVIVVTFIPKLQHLRIWTDIFCSELVTQFYFPGNETKYFQDSDTVDAIGYTYKEHY